MMRVFINCCGGGGKIWWCSSSSLPCHLSPLVSDDGWWLFLGCHDVGGVGGEEEEGCAVVVSSFMDYYYYYSSSTLTKRRRGGRRLTGGLPPPAGGRIKTQRRPTGETGNPALVLCTWSSSRIFMFSPLATPDSWSSPSLEFAQEY